MQWVFETLGIDKQADASTVRKAYAKALKQCDQVTEADRFQRIRQAYEFALQWARQREAAAAVPASPSPSPDAPVPAAQPSIAKSHVQQQPAAPTTSSAPPAELRPSTPPPLESQPLAAQPDQKPYASPANGPREAFASPSPQPRAPLQSSPPVKQAVQPPVAVQPIGTPQVVRLPATPPPTPASPFRANERMVDPRIAASPSHVPAGEGERGSAGDVLREFLAEVRKPNVMSARGVLGVYANDARLTSLDAKAEFEQALLVQIFVAPVDMSLLDAACDLFAWETSHRHLGMRPDLVHRMLRQQSLRHVLAATKIEDRTGLDEAVRIYRLLQQQPKIRAEPWQIVNTNRLLERFEPFKFELGERYSAEAFDWWRQRLAGDPALLASYKEKKQAPPAPPPVRHSQRSSRGRTGGLLYLWPILAVLGSIAGHFSSDNTSRYDPGSYTPPARVSQSRPQPPNMPTTVAADPSLMDISQLRFAANLGDAKAQYYLALRYENGTQVAQDLLSAVYWYRRAADQDLPEAQYKLGELNAKGRGVPTDREIAVMWWRKAALGGNALAQDRLARAYANGDGVRRDYQQALQWWQKAAGQNVPNAKTGLGWLYQNGYGVPPDAKAAVDWYRQAAAQGDTDAQNNLAVMYEHGEGGLPADPVIAAALLKVAADHQKSYAANWAYLDRLTAHFTSAQHSAYDSIARDLSSPSNNFIAVLDSAQQFRHRK
jgi:TPR repeat protein